jgi:hypothetical protein
MYKDKSPRTPLYERGERKEEWGMIAAVAGLIIVGVFFAVRRKRISFNS